MMPATMTRKRAKTPTKDDWKRQALALADCLGELSGLVDALLEASKGTGTVGIQQHRTARRKHREAVQRVARVLGVSVTALDKGEL